MHRGGMQSHPTTSDIVKRPPSSRSRVGNGSALFVDETVDGRSKEARRFRDVLAEIAGDLGGLDHMSEGQKQLARRCALLAVECEKLEAKSVSGEPIDLESYGKLCDRIGRAFQRLGLKRVARVVGNPLADHFARPIVRKEPEAA